MCRIPDSDWNYFTGGESPGCMLQKIIFYCFQSSLQKLQGILMFLTLLLFLQFEDAGKNTVKYDNNFTQQTLAKNTLPDISITVL